MKIKEVSTRQFAGIKNKNIQLDEGLNLLVGKNETGKSTIIQLIYQILYRNSNLDKRADKDFFDYYMPSGGKGDVVDGKLVFRTNNGDYTLEKKWGAASSVEIVDSKGNIIASEERINGIINDELIYKRGLYNDVVFASQKNQVNVVEHILKKLDKKATEKQDFVSIIASEAMTTTGGVQPDDIEKVIKARIEKLSAHWDFDIDIPEKRRGIENPWKVNVGEILSAYYIYAQTEEKLRRAELAEKAIDNHNNRISERQKILAELKAEKEEYERFAEVIATFNANKQLKEQYTENEIKLLNDKKAYPNYLDELAKSIKLRNIKDAKEIVDRYTSIIEKKEKYDSLNKELQMLNPIDADDVKKVSSLDSELASKKAKLANLNLVANIKKLRNVDVQIKSVATGEILPLTDDLFEINETVEILIPDILSITLSAKGVDVEQVKAEINELQSEIAVILEKSHAKDYEDMLEKREKYSEVVSKFEVAKNEYTNLIDGLDMNKLENDYIRVKDLAIGADDIDNQIKELCGSETIEAYVAKQEQKVAQIEEEYGADSTIDAIEKKLAEVQDRLEKIKAREKDAEQIPQKYLDLTDIDEYKNNLNERMDATVEQIEEAKRDLEADKIELGDVSPDDLRVSLEDERIELQRLKDECKHWKHILSVLETTRDGMTGESTMQDVQSRFADYLRNITDGRVSLNSMDENMDVDIQSGDNHLSYEILSEGTKDTIGLAFRLAMLEHLFPEGGGLVVLDDPFTEMDEDRTKQACKLVQQFADNGNQVIFVTCDSKYKNLLSGKTIDL